MLPAQPPERPVVEAVVALARALREQGLAARLDRELVLCQALGEIDIRHRPSMYWASRATFLGRPEEIPRFDAVFERFWQGLSLDMSSPASEHGESDPRLRSAQHGGQEMPQFRREGQSERILDGQASRARQETLVADQTDGDPRQHRQRGVLAAYSPDDVTVAADPLSFDRDELAAIRRLAEELSGRLPERLCRRHRPSRRHGRLDLRGTLRASLRTGGEWLRPAYTAPSRRPRRLVLLCDVSGSMERYSRALLAALQGVVGSQASAEAFVFATRLTRLTSTLSRRHAEAALTQARIEVADWSGGTRIGEAIAAFHRTYGRRGFARGAIVLIVSDGWDRGDPELLARELERLRLQARRLVWINPRPAGLDGQPLAVGMRTALPYVDDFVSGQDPAALAALAELIGGLNSARPTRAQRPVALVPDQARAE